MGELSDTRVEFRWPASLVAAVDVACGDVSRSLWVRRLVEKALRDAEEPVGSPSTSGVRSVVGPAPSEPVDRAAAFRAATQGKP